MKRGAVRRLILARHGKPAWDSSTWIPGRGLGEWVRGRDAAPIDPTRRPPEELLQVAAGARAFVASSLRRSLESLHLVAPEVIPLTDAVFREVSLPVEIHSRIRLPPQVWSKIARTRWYRGWSPGVESHAAAERRATEAATLLMSIAPPEGDLLLVGHGIFNGMILRRLRRAGWQGPRFRPRRLWAFAVYTEPNP